MYIVFTLFQLNQNSTSLVKLKSDPESQEPFCVCKQMNLLPEYGWVRVETDINGKF